MEEHVRLHTPKTDAPEYAIMPTGEAFFTREGLGELKTVFAGWFKSWKCWGGIQGPTVEAHSGFMDIPFILSYEEVA